MEQSLPNYVKVAPFIVFYLIHSMQVGSGLFGFQQIIAKEAGYDAWIMVIVTGILIHVSLWNIFEIVETVDGDLVSVHTFIWGNIFGKIISSIFIAYFIMLAITAIASFIEVVQIWMFPRFNKFLFTAMLLILVIFVVGGGLRTVGGVAFFGAIIPIIVYISFLYTLKYSTFQNLLPIFDHSLKEMAHAGYRMSLSYLGFETLLIYYPFINQPKKAKKWAHLGLIVTALLYTYVALLTFAFYAEEQLKIAIWPTLTMWKIVKLPLLERFEYVGIATWMFLILPNICLAIWASSRLFKRIFSMNMRTGVYISVIICLFILPLFNTTIKVEALKTFSANAGVIVTFCYMPILLLMVWIARRVKNK